MAITTLALKNDGTVWGWGDNGYGEPGNGSATVFGEPLSPVQAVGLSGAVAIRVGASRILAVKSDGTDWGENECGQGGNGTTTSSTLPDHVSQDARLSIVVAGQNLSLAE